VGLDLAGAVAPIAGHRVPVVTFLDAVLIVDSVATTLRRFAARGVRGVACLRGTGAAGCDACGEIDAGPTGSARSGVATGASASHRASLASGALNGCTAAANSCQRDNCGEAEACKLACE
jgi:hypothetical protein